MILRGGAAMRLRPRPSRRKSHSMLLPDLQTDFEAIADNLALREEKNFVGRFQAIDALEFNILDPIEALFPSAPQQASMLRLRQRAEKLKEELETLDQALFDRLRREIRDSGITGETFKAMVRDYVASTPSQSESSGTVGYDALDAFVNGLLHCRPIPAETRVLEAGMVYFQKTPARIVWEMAEKARLNDGDTFVDLGSGLGQVTLLMHLLTGAKTRGIEFEPAYCDYARACAADLNLHQADFERIDAREADLSSGQVFFLYTPFEGTMFQSVLQRMRSMARRQIQIFTYGPCTLEMQKQVWLHPTGGRTMSIHKLVAFERR